MKKKFELKKSKMFKMASFVYNKRRRQFEWMECLPL